ncbi:MAG: Nif3-like dinuclear metal center hexameric protein [Patescibacteria group bacterium]|jgi:dinuclear metal center YbgI/SA1388 family protein
MKTDALFTTIHDKILGPELLAKANQVDTNANGVQIKGDDEVKKIALGVSCNTEFLQKAANWGADVCIFHHGLSLSDKYIYNSRLTPSLQKQLKVIFENNLTVAGYHFALDTHEKIGNNIQIIKALGAKETKELYFDNWGMVAEFSKPQFIQDVAKECSKLFRHDIFMVLGETEKVARFGVCSGSAIPSSADVMEIVENGLELHITGVITESSSAVAKESGFHYFAAGHYATEVFGVKALGKEIKKKFPSLEVEFIDVWNEL